MSRFVQAQANSKKICIFHARHASCQPPENPEKEGLTQRGTATKNRRRTRPWQPISRCVQYGVLLLPLSRKNNKTISASAEIALLSMYDRRSRASTTVTVDRSKKPLPILFLSISVWIDAGIYWSSSSETRSIYRSTANYQYEASRRGLSAHFYLSCRVGELHPPREDRSSMHDRLGSHRSSMTR
jgi:hypothetical protein